MADEEHRPVRKQDGVLDAPAAQAAERAAEDVPPRRSGALWPESAVSPPKGDAVTDAPKEEKERGR